MVRQIVHLRALLCLLVQCSTSSSDYYFVVISDAHVDPTYNASLSRACKCNAEYDSDGTCVSSGRPHGSRRFGQYGCDAPRALFSSALAEARRVAPAPAFAVFLGDAARHAAHSAREVRGLVSDTRAALSSSPALASSSSSSGAEGDEDDNGAARPWSVPLFAALGNTDIFPEVRRRGGVAPLSLDALACAELAPPAATLSPVRNRAARRDARFFSFRLVEPSSPRRGSASPPGPPRCSRATTFNRRFVSVARPALVRLSSSRRTRDRPAPRLLSSSLVFSRRRPPFLPPPPPPHRPLGWSRRAPLRRRAVQYTLAIAPSSSGGDDDGPTAAADADDDADDDNEDPEITLAQLAHRLGLSAAANETFLRGGYYAAEAPPR